MFNSVVLAVIPSRVFNSAVLAVTPSNLFNSAVLAVTPSRMLSSVESAVTPRSLNPSGLASSAACSPSTLAIVWLWLSSAMTVVIVMLEEPSKSAAPATSPAKEIVRAVTSLVASDATPTTVALIVPSTVISPETSRFVNVPAAAEVAPITVPSMLPPLMSTVLSVALPPLMSTVLSVAWPVD